MTAVTIFLHARIMELTFTEDLEMNVWMIGGKTFIWKEKIKSLGSALWNPTLKVWQVPLSTDLTMLRDAVIWKAEENIIKKKEEEERKAKAPKPYWVCCEKAKIIDYRRRMTSCGACAVDGNTVRKNGNIYTGD